MSAETVTRPDTAAGGGTDEPPATARLASNDSGDRRDWKAWEEHPGSSGIDEARLQAAWQQAGWGELRSFEPVAPRIGRLGVGVAMLPENGFSAVAPRRTPKFDSGEIFIKHIIR